MEARRDGERIKLSGSKVHTVLATLLMAHGKVVSDSRLTAMLWGWDPPATANAQIYTYMSRLRQYLGVDVVIARRAPGYVLTAPGARIDLLEFERLDRLGREALGQHRFPDARRLLRLALDLWHGSALANVTEHLQDVELPRLDEARMLTLESRIEADLALGLHEQVTAELTGLVAEYPVRERLRAQLMTALHRGGRQADALRVYGEGRTVLAEQLGVDPGEALRSTHQAILVSGVGRPAVTRTPHGEDRTFLGRAEELNELVRRMTGPAGRTPGPLVTRNPGVGEPAPAVRAASESVECFPDCLLLVELCRAILSSVRRGEYRPAQSALPDPEDHVLSR
ncbi:AfsR/SARP family transcriptional regulator [Streptacidiphilus jiangxiensis]|uniref:AfsR/SARP family transcriptional regulator n=1 Tax=Streptacidiphilus jiangxiensis TaxID=235985 RepID=UPI000945631D|nr:AfsR/SARP family transcriptional regulator [Streptacidiphilus jiangxiensis]